MMVLIYKYYFVTFFMGHFLFGIYLVYISYQVNRRAKMSGKVKNSGVYRIATHFCVYNILHF